MLDPINVEEIASDNEWIAEKEEPTLLTKKYWFAEELDGQMANLSIDAVTSVPLGTYQNSLIRESIIPLDPTPPREPTPPHEPTPPSVPTSCHDPAPSLNEPILLYKRKSSQEATSSLQKVKKKPTRKYKNVNNLEDDGFEKSNPLDDTNPIYQVNYYNVAGGSGNNVDLDDVCLNDDNVDNDVDVNVENDVDVDLGDDEVGDESGDSLDDELF